MINTIRESEFTMKKCPGKILDLCNEFFPFLDEIKYLDFMDDKQKISYVENIIHLSYWL